MGAIASGGVRVLNSKVLNQLSNAEKSLREASAKEEQELKRRKGDIGKDASFDRSREKRSSWLMMACRPAQPCEPPQLL